MACSKEFSRFLLFLKTSSNIQPFWFALLVDHGCTFCNQLAHIWARTAALLSHPSFCLNCKSDVFLLHVVHISWYSFNRKIQCLCLMKLHVSDLGNGCPVAASPAITTLTTEQPSKSHDLSWAFQVTTALPKAKCRNHGATSGVAGLSLEQEHSWGWQSLCVPCSSFKAFGEKPWQGEK